MPCNDLDTPNPLPSFVFPYKIQSAAVVTIGSQVKMRCSFASVVFVSKVVQNDALRKHKEELQGTLDKENGTGKTRCFSGIFKALTIQRCNPGSSRNFAIASTTF
ncbi:hypothetical protein M0804_001571 [Polistes exclamans]|nr:hypothetical protein M0804_001571 [Polistes exclamans]